MPVLKRYYVEVTGRSGDRATGILLNKDGSVYTGGMKDVDFTDVEIQNSLPALSVDGYDIRIQVVTKDAEHSPNAKVSLVFYQEDPDGSKSSVASVRMTKSQLEALRNTISDKLRDFTS